MEHKTMFVIGWLSETCGNEPCAGVCSNVFPTRKQAETEMRKFMEMEKDDMSSHYDDEIEVVVDYDKHAVFDVCNNEYVKYQIHEVDVKF